MGGGFGRGALQSEGLSVKLALPKRDGGAQPPQPDAWVDLSREPCDQASLPSSDELARSWMSSLDSRLKPPAFNGRLADGIPATGVSVRGRLLSSVFD